LKPFNMHVYLEPDGIVRTRLEDTNLSVLKA